MCALRAPSTLRSATFLGGEVRAASLRTQNQGMAGEPLAEGGFWGPEPPAGSRMLAQGWSYTCWAWSRRGHHPQGTSP